jgi:hypothetical protein
MNDFVRQVRTRLDEAGQTKGRKLTLMARVLPSLELNRKIGLDVSTWIREGWVDMIAPSTRGYLDISADLTPFVELARTAGVQVSGGLSDLYVRDYTGRKTGRASIEMLRAAAAAGSGAGLAGADARAGANVMIGRARYDLYAESHLGAMVTTRDFLDNASRMVLADGAFRLGQTQSLGFSAVQTDNRDLDGVDSRGRLFDVNYRLNGRHWSIFNGTYTLSPDFRTDVGFVRRTDQRRNVTTLGYRFWPESWLINWGPSVSFGRNWNYDDVLEDESLRASLNATFANNISASVSVNRDMERYLGVNFHKESYRAFGRVSSSRKFSVGGFFQYGDEVRYQENPFLGRGGSGGMFATIRPVPRFQSQIDLNTSRLIDPRDDRLVFDVTIVRALSTYQVSDRLALRNIAEFNTLQGTVGLNVLASYRVNAGTVFYIGYDDRYRQGDLILGDDLDGDGVPDYLFPSVTALPPQRSAIAT